jgi:hypothetical protein
MRICCVTWPPFRLFFAGHKTLTRGAEKKLGVIAPQTFLRQCVRSIVVALVTYADLLENSLWVRVVTKKFHHHSKLRVFKRTDSALIFAVNMASASRSE